MRRITVRDSVVTNNLANDDGGGLYARRGGVQVFDSVVSNNLVDGIGRRDRVHPGHPSRPVPPDGNTTDGDGGAPTRTRTATLLRRLDGGRLRRRRARWGDMDP